MTATLESRHLGTIDLDGGSGGGAMDGTVPFAGHSLPVRIEIDYPDRFGDAILNDIDMVLDRLDFVDGLARDTIAEGMRRDASAPAQLYQAWQRKGAGREDATAEFLGGLRPTRIVVLPDGGRSNPDRVVMTYGLADGSVTGAVTVRFLEPTGPELAPAPRAGF